MTKIKDIVSINSQAVLSNAVQLAWYGDPALTEETGKLVGGYIFGNGITRRIGNHTEISSLPVFEKIRESFGNPSASHIFTIVANYGHGKSHFALVLANYFGLGPNSPVVEEIITHIETCSNKVTAEQFRFFKNQTHKAQLVLTLVGNQFDDLRQGFLRALRRALDANEMTRNRPIKAVYAKAIEWLRSLDDDKTKRADEYLTREHQTDVDALMAALENFESDKELIARDLSRELHGIEGDFGASVNLKEIIKDTVDELCTGAEAPFHKMLILFDELGIYTKFWCHRPMAAGNFAPQNIFEACDDLKGKVCFVGFVPEPLNSFVQGYSAELQNEFKKWAGRMKPESTYHLVSNLEEVIGKLIIKNSKWKPTIKDNSPQITEESRMVWETIVRYKETWDPNAFYQTVARDCYPLHPFTTALICGFKFTQGSRTIIAAVNSMLSQAEEQELNVNGKLNWIRPIELVEEFNLDFREDSTEFSKYEYAVAALKRDEDQILFDVLKALFLYNEGKINKQNKYDHAALLAHLAGYGEPDIKSALERLRDDYDAVRYSGQLREYEFTGVGTNRKVVLDLVRREVTGKTVDSLVRYLHRLRAFEDLRPHDSEARDFKTEFAVQGDEWFLVPRFLDAANLRPESLKKLCIETNSEGTGRGIVVYLLSTKLVELEEARENAESVLDELRTGSFSDPVVIAVPREAATQLEIQVLMKDYLVNTMSNPSKAQLGESYRAAVELVNKELMEQLIEHIRTAEFVVPSELRLKIGSKEKGLDQLADVLFADVYKFRAPANSNVMKPTAQKGNTATAEIARQLISDELNFSGLLSERQNIVKQVLVDGPNRWGILDTNYGIQDPKNVRVLEAWAMLRKSVSENEWTTFGGLLQKLMQHPFGYDDYTATFLIAAWIGRHKYELGFKDSKKQAQTLTKNNQSNLTLADLQTNLNRSKDFIKWLRRDVSVRQAGRENKRRAQEFFNQLRAVNDASGASALLEQANSILQTLRPGDRLADEIRKEAEEVVERVQIADFEKKNLEKYREAASLASEVASVLRVRESLNEFGSRNELQSSPAFVEAAKFVDSRIGTVAHQQTQITLPRIESYDSVYGSLEKSRKALSKAGRSDLEALFITALQRVNNEYQRLQSEKAEEPLITEISSIQIGGGMPLSFYRDRLKRIEAILGASPSERVNQAGKSKYLQLERQIRDLLGWIDNLVDRSKSIADITSGQQLQKEIFRRENLYSETPEAHILLEATSRIGTRINDLDEDQQRKEAAKRDQLRREREKRVAEGITSQFGELTDSEKRFDCLVDILKLMKVEGLSDEQKRVLIDLLQ
jgi:hypothetical protein